MRFGIFSLFFFSFILFSETSSVEAANKTISYELINDFPVAASAKVIWAAYADLNLPVLIAQLLPEFFERIDILEGNGGVGTVLRITYHPGSVPRTLKERFVTVDDRRRLKEVLQIEGGYLDMGVTYYIETFQVLPRGRNSCIIRSVIKYDVYDESQAVVSPLITVDALLNMARAISKHALEKKIFSIADI